MHSEENKTPLAERKVVRRGLIAGLAGMAAAALLKAAKPSDVEAADGQQLVIGTSNDGTNTTHLRNNHNLLPTMTLRNGTAVLIANPTGDAFQAFTEKNVSGSEAGIRGVGVNAGITGSHPQRVWA